MVPQLRPRNDGNKCVFTCGDKGGEAISVLETDFLIFLRKKGLLQEFALSSASSVFLLQKSTKYRNGASASRKLVFPTSLPMFPYTQRAFGGNWCSKRGGSSEIAKVEADCRLLKRAQIIKLHRHMTY